MSTSQLVLPFALLSSLFGKSQITKKIFYGLQIKGNGLVRLVILLSNVYFEKKFSSKVCRFLAFVFMENCFFLVFRFWTLLNLLVLLISLFYVWEAGESL